MSMSMDLGRLPRPLFVSENDNNTKNITVFVRRSNHSEYNLTGPPKNFVRRKQNHENNKEHIMLLSLCRVARENVKTKNTVCDDADDGWQTCATTPSHAAYTA